MTATVNDMDKRQRTIGALLDRAAHPDTPAAEAELAASRAQELATKYQIDLERVRQMRADNTVDPNFGLDVTEYHLGKPRSHGLLNLALLLTNIGRLNGAEVVWTPQTGTARIYGYTEDVDLTMRLYESLSAQMRNQEKVRRAEFREHGMAWSKVDFMFGFVCGALQVLKEARDRALSAETGSALMLANKEVKVRAFFQENAGETGKARRVQAKASASYYSGVVEGQKADVTSV